MSTLHALCSVACTGGAQAPAPLRSEAKVPLRSGLCDMNDIVDEISNVTAAVCVGHQVPVAQKKRKKKRDTSFPRPRPLAPHACGWMQMIITDGQLCLWKDISSLAPRKKKKKKMKTKPARHFQVGCIHNQRSIKTIYIYCVYIFVRGYKNRPKPTTAFKMNDIKTMRQPCWKNTIEPSQKILTPSQINHKCHYKPSTFNH